MRAVGAHVPIITDSTVPNYVPSMATVSSTSSVPQYDFASCLGHGWHKVAFGLIYGRLRSDAG